MTAEGSGTGATWRPVLQGEPAERAREAIEDIARSLREPPRDWTPDASLGGGYAGFALFHGYMALAGIGGDQADRAFEWIERALEAITDSGMMPDLFGGFAGVGWVVDHLDGRVFDGGGEDASRTVEEALVAALDRQPLHAFWHRRFDLVTGLVGVGLYALQRWPRASAVGLLRSVLDRLEAMSESAAEGITWSNDPPAVYRGRRIDPSSVYFNLGVAHGVPAIIGFLAQVAATGLESDRARRLLDGSLAWLVAKRLAPVERGFPARLGLGEDDLQARTAWCYGQLGIAAVLATAGETLGDPGLAELSIELAQAEARRRPEDCGVVDACLCHGSAGIGHLYARLHQASGSAVFREAAIGWHERTHALRGLDGGVAGFRYWGRSASGDEEWIDTPGFLNGAAGIGLALLAAVTTVEPAWDRVLLVSSSLGRGVASTPDVPSHP